MKKFLSLILSLGLLFLLGCAKTIPADTGITTGTIATPPPPMGQNTPERQTYQNKPNGFSLQFPGDRTFQENVYGAAVVFSSPITETDKIKENVSVVKKPLTKEYTLEDYYTLLKEELVKQPDYMEIENSTIKVNNLDAKKMIFKSSSNNTKLEFEQIVLIKNKAVYILTYTATEATFKEYAQKIDEMIATLEIK